MISLSEFQPADVDLVSRVEAIFSPTGILSRSKNFEFRPQQQAMATAVARALQDREHLAVEAGTGVGISRAGHFVRRGREKEGHHLHPYH